MLLSLNALLLAKRMLISRRGEGEGVRKTTREERKEERGRREKEKSTFLYINRRMLEKKMGMSRKEKILEDVNIVVSEILFKMKLNEN